MSYLLCLSPLLWGACARSSSSANSTTTPTLTSVNPTSGAAVGGNQIIMVGTGFSLTSTVTVNGRACTDLEHISGTSLACIVPALTGGTSVSVIVDVQVTNRNFTTGDIAAGTLVGGYTYHPPPTVTSATPGFYMGGTTITVTGTGFRTGATVLIGSTSCDSVTVVGGTSLTCVSPAGTSLASANITVTNIDDQDETLASGFTWRQTQFNSFVDGNGTDGFGKDVSKNGSVARLIELNDKLYGSWQESTGTVDEIRAAVYGDNDTTGTWAMVDGNLSTGLNYDTTKNARNPDLTIFNSKMTAVWDEAHSGTGVKQIRVKQYNGNDSAPSWTFIDGNTAVGINRNTGRIAQTPRAVPTSSSFYVAFTEENGTPNTQIRVKKYNTGTWSNFDTSNAENGLNINPSKNATSPSIAYLSGRLYLAWQEVSNTSIDTVHVSCNEDENSATWTPITGTGLNRVSTRHARYPRLTVFNNKIYATWVEEASAAGPQQVRVARFDGASCSASNWVFVDGNSISVGLNKDTTRSAQYPVLSSLSTFLYVTWAESDGSATNIRVKHLSNEASGAWTSVDGDGTSGINKSTSRNANNPALLSHASKLYNVWQETNGTNTTIRAKVGK